jgi:hypothetical protein
MYRPSIQPLMYFAFSPFSSTISLQRRSNRESCARSVTRSLSSVTCQNRWRRGCGKDSAESEASGRVACHDSGGTANLAKAIRNRTGLSLPSEDGGGHEGQRGVVVRETHGGYWCLLVQVVRLPYMFKRSAHDLMSRWMQPLGVKSVW